MTTHLARWLLMFVIGTWLCTDARVAIAAGTIDTATEGKTDGVFKASGLEPSNGTTERYFLYQETSAGSGTFERIGAFNTDNKGNITESLPLVPPTADDESLPLKKGRKVRLSRDRTKADPIPGIGDKTVSSISIGPLGPLFPGDNRLASFDLPQSTSDGAFVLLETWDAGTFYSLSLLPAEASWRDFGVSLVTDGDLSVALLGITPQTILLQVLSDPTITTSDDIHFFGLGINVLPDAKSVGLELGWLGSYSAFLNGQFLNSASSDHFVVREVDRVAVAEPPVWSLMALVGLMLVPFYRRFMVF
jgi:hypothetical protein